MYVDPSIYASADEALQDFSKEIPPKSVRIHEEIARGIWLNCLIEIWPCPAMVKALFTVWHKALTLYCVEHAKQIFHDQTQECNAEESKPSDGWSQF